MLPLLGVWAFRLLVVAALTAALVLMGASETAQVVGGLVGRVFRLAAVGTRGPHVDAPFPPGEGGRES